MKFILYSAVNEQNISESLGKPEYSYYFVYKGFKRALAELGEVITVHRPEEQVDAIYNDSLAADEPCYFFSFSPPNKTPTNLACPTIPVIAWEFDSLPNAEHGMEGKEDWVAQLRACGQAITLSTHTQQVIKKYLGDDFPVAAIPVPVCDDQQQHRATREPHNGPLSLHVEGILLDTEDYTITDQAITHHAPNKAFHLTLWDGEEITLSFKRGAPNPAAHCGFHDPEDWGTWSNYSSAWVVLPAMIRGEVSITLEHVAFGYNVGRTITVTLGESSQSMTLNPGTTTLHFNLEEPAGMLVFSGMDTRLVEGQRDHRQLGIGLISLTVESSHSIPCKKATSPPLPTAVHIDQVLYTSVLNPECGRKNWHDMITAFFYAFRNEPNACLLIKASADNISGYFSDFHKFLAKFSPFQCRVIIVDGFLSSADYQQLTEATDYYVNTSRSEGLCLPLMEFMVHGVPAVSPRHTAMEDYIWPSNSFIVDADTELTVWPHDPEHRFSAYRYRLNWETLLNQFKNSYVVINENAERYAAKCDAAAKSIKDYASISAVKDKLTNFLGEQEWP